MVVLLVSLVGPVGVGGSESEAESASSSQESATSVAFFLLVFTSAEAFGLVCVGRVMSLIAGPLSLRDSWRREDWSSESVQSADCLYIHRGMD